jgi:hypothetical protein
VLFELGQKGSLINLLIKGIGQLFIICKNGNKDEQRNGKRQ